VLGHLLPSIQVQSFLEWTPTCFEQCLTELCAILLEEHFQVALEVLEVFLTLVFKTDQSGSVTFKSGDCAGQGRCWSSSSCSSNHYWTVQAMSMGPLFSCKTTSLFGNNVWITESTWLPNLSKYSLALIRPWRVILGPLEYCITIFLPKQSENLPRVSLLDPDLPDCKLPWVFSKCKLFLM
jgi:hypothetical protein